MSTPAAPTPSAAPAPAAPDPWSTRSWPWLYRPVTVVASAAVLVLLVVAGAALVVVGWGARAGATWARDLAPAGSAADGRAADVQLVVAALIVVAVTASFVVGGGGRTGRAWSVGRDRRVRVLRAAGDAGAGQDAPDARWAARSLATEPWRVVALPGVGVSVGLQAVDGHDAGLLVVASAVLVLWAAVLPAVLRRTAIGAARLAAHEG